MEPISEVRQFDLVQAGVKRITDSRDATVGEREYSEKADAPDADAASVIARCNIEVIKAKAETTRQQGVLSRKIDEISAASDEKVLKYNSQISALYDEALRAQSRSGNIQEARSSKDEIPLHPKREVSIAFSGRPMSPGTTNAILSALDQMNAKMSALSDRQDRSDERASSSRPSQESARG